MTRRLSTRISRKLRLLRAHCVIQKIPKTHRHRRTAAGQILAAALSAVRNATLEHRVAAAA